MLDLIDQGGHLMWILLACSILAFVVFIERLLYFRRISVNLGQLFEGLRNLILKKNYAEALQHTAVTPGPAARVMHSVLMRRGSPRQELREIARSTGQLEVPKLERRLGILLAIAYVTPLLGLLGTFLGLMDALSAVKGAQGFASNAALSEGIYRSIITSAAGLAVAVPAYLMHAYLVTRARGMVHHIEHAGVEIVNLITDSREQRDVISLADEEEKSRQG